MKKRPLSRVEQAKLDQAFLRSFRVDAHGQQQGRCEYCREPLTYSRTTADHVVARARHGLDERNNIVAACEPCNRQKGAMQAVLFRRLVNNPGPTTPLAFWLVWSRLRINRRLELMERRLARATGRKLQ